MTILHLPTSAAPRDLDPGLVDDLCRAGLDPSPRPGEEPRTHLRRVETFLMQHFRDSGSERAFAVLHERTRLGLLAWITRLIGGGPVPADPLELLQDTFVNVYRYAGSFRPESGGFRPWARTIAGNVLRRRRRQALRRPLLLAPELLPEDVDTAAGPDRLVADAEECAHLSGAAMLFLLHYRAAWERLSLRDRTALELVEARGWSHASAAERLAVGRSNMKMILFRARRRLRAHMARAMGLELESLQRIAG